MHAVYELSTVKPHLPARPRYTLAELEIYSAGYYRALVMALRVMQLAFRRWESRTMRDQKPTLIAPPHIPPAGDAGSDQADDLESSVAFYVITGFCAVAALEFLALGAALILRLLR